VLSCAIDAKEGKYVVVTDIPGAFLHADMEGNIHMILEGTISELIVKLEPNLYRKETCLVQSKRKANALHTTQKGIVRNTTSSPPVLEAILITLQEWGFKINEYDHCVANKLIKGKQCTILWHVDDLKILHVDKK